MDWRTRSGCVGALLVAAGLVGGPSVVGVAEASQRGGSGVGVVVDAVSRASEDLALSFTISGRVAEVLVEEGDEVAAGEALVRLDSRLARLDEAIAAAAAGSVAEVDSARATLALLETELVRVRDAASREAAATFEVERKALEVQRARARVRIEEERRELARLRLERARAVVADHGLSSPIAGRVERVTVSPGETVEALSPVVRVVRVDPLRVDAAVPVWRTLTLVRGDAAWVRLVSLDGPGEAVGAWLRGEVASLASVGDAGSETREVRVVLENDEGLPAGARVVVRFDRPAVSDGGVGDG